MFACVPSRIVFNRLRYWSWHLCSLNLNHSHGCSGTRAGTCCVADLLTFQWWEGAKESRIPARPEVNGAKS